MSLRATSPTQISFAALLLLQFPVYIYTHHTALHKDVWEAHRSELDDRRILCWTYYVASFTFSMSLPVFASLVTGLIGFAILDWDYSAFFVTWLIGSFYLLLVLEVGRSLCLFFYGDIVYWKITLLLLFVDAMFSGVMASPADAPPGV